MSRWINESAKQWLSEPIGHWTDEPMKRWLCESMTQWRAIQWIHKSMDQCKSELVSQWTNDWVNKWINEWMNERTNERMNEWMNGWSAVTQRTNEKIDSVNQWTHEAMNQWIHEPMSQWINEPTNERMDGWMGGWVDGRMHACMHEWMKNRRATFFIELLLHWRCLLSATSSLSSHSSGLLVLWTASQLFWSFIVLLVRPFQCV